MEFSWFWNFYELVSGNEWVSSYGEGSFAAMERKKKEFEFSLFIWKTCLCGEEEWVSFQVWTNNFNWMFFGLSISSMEHLYAFFLFYRLILTTGFFTTNINLSQIIFCIIFIYV